MHKINIKRTRGGVSPAQHPGRTRELLVNKSGGQYTELYRTVYNVLETTSLTTGSWQDFTFYNQAISAPPVDTSRFDYAHEDSNSPATDKYVEIHRESWAQDEFAGFHVDLCSRAEIDPPTTVQSAKIEVKMLYWDGSAWQDATAGTQVKTGWEYHYPGVVNAFAVGPKTCCTCGSWGWEKLTWDYDTPSESKYRLKLQYKVASGVTVDRVDVDWTIWAWRGPKSV